MTFRNDNVIIEKDHKLLMKSEMIDNVVLNETLMHELSKQIHYYFSPQNLASDVYMNKIMRENSGYVPVSTLMNFAKVKKIISRHTEGINIITSNLQNILLNSVVGSSDLEIVSLNSYGEHLADYGDNDFGSKISSHVIAIRSNVSANEVLEKNDSKKSYLVILRDVPEEATEVDVRNIFSNADGKEPIIENIQKEVGKCWFVALSSAASQSSLVSLLLDLRSKTICGEPIKARLKTKSIIARSSYQVFSEYDPYSRGSMTEYQSHVNEYHSKSEERGSHLKKNGAKSYSKQKKKFESDDWNRRIHDLSEKSAPPDLCEMQFPFLLSLNLPESKKKSNVTTATGYASVLMKSFDDVQQTLESKCTNCAKKYDRKSNTSDEKSATSVSSTDDSSTSSKSTMVERSECNIHVTLAHPDMTWGRSFADIVKS